MAFYLHFDVLSLGREHAVNLGIDYDRLVKNADCDRHFCLSGHSFSWADYLSWTACCEPCERTVQNVQAHLSNDGITAA